MPKYRIKATSKHYIPQIKWWFLPFWLDLCEWYYYSETAARAVIKDDYESRLARKTKSISYVDPSIQKADLDPPRKLQDY